MSSFWERLLHDLADRAATAAEDSGAVATNTTTFVVPVGKIWTLDSIAVRYTSDATLGNRRLAIEVDDGANVYARFLADVQQAASLTRFYAFGSGLVADAAFVVDALRSPLAALTLAVGWRVHVKDDAGISAGDSLRALVSHRG